MPDLIAVEIKPRNKGLGVTRRGPLSRVPADIAKLFSRPIVVRPLEIIVAVGRIPRTIAGRASRSVTTRSVDPGRHALESGGLGVDSDIHIDTRN